MNTTTATPQQKINRNAPLSTWAKFHIKFRGYSFKNTQTQRTKTKLELYQSLTDRQKDSMINDGILPKNIVTVDSIGWKNGEMISTEFIN